MNGYKDIPGYEGLYAVNRSGDIWSYYAGRNIKANRSYRGYYSVGLRKKGLRKWFMLHRLIGQAFLENPDSKRYINHKDFNKANNTVDNIEWVTASENMMHAQRHGRVNTKEQQEKIRDSCGFLTMAQARVIRFLYKTGRYTQGAVGNLFGVSEDVVYHVLKNNTYREYGG